ncbi:uncharacterized protein LOC117181283 [Belonocnema kinseyi]|uniref:uncharacterized protein LOC117181283 n=1 Tax=Belonocnema kinseyi TaxID=2817044 RepID=UPI00143DB4E7|nr:uncharacterized protein LOC117181283 [Belonocnema kinseyi]
MSQVFNEDNAVSSFKSVSPKVLIRLPIFILRSFLARQLLSGSPLLARQPPSSPRFSLVRRLFFGPCTLLARQLLSGPPLLTRQPPSSPRFSLARSIMELDKKVMHNIPSQLTGKLFGTN